MEASTSKGDDQEVGNDCINDEDYETDDDIEPKDYDDWSCTSFLYFANLFSLFH